LSNYEKVRLKSCLSAPHLSAGVLPSRGNIKATTIKMLCEAMGVWKEKFLQCLKISESLQVMIRSKAKRFMGQWEEMRMYCVLKRNGPGEILANCLCQ